MAADASLSVFLEKYDHLNDGYDGDHPADPSINNNGRSDEGEGVSSSEPHVGESEGEDSLKEKIITSSRRRVRFASRLKQTVSQLNMPTDSQHETMRTPSVHKNRGDEENSSPNESQINEAFGDQLGSIVSVARQQRTQLSTQDVSHNKATNAVSASRNERDEEDARKHEIIDTFENWLGQGETVVPAHQRSAPQNADNEENESLPESGPDEYQTCDSFESKLAATVQVTPFKKPSHYLQPGSPDDDIESNHASMSDPDFWAMIGGDDDGNNASKVSSANQSNDSENGLVNFYYGDFNIKQCESELDPGVMAALRRTQLECDKSAKLGQRLPRARNRMRVVKAFQHSVGDEAYDTRLTPSMAARRDSTRDSLLASMHRSAITEDDILNFSDQLLDMEKDTKLKDWFCSVRDLDPRNMILNFFNELSLEGVDNFESQGGIKGSIHVPKILRMFIKCGVFSVWRPTSNDAIRKMITGEGTGKGLDIKGKSAKCGEFSGFVPFMQIHDNGHKKKVGAMRAKQRIRVFYPNQASRDEAAAVLNLLSKAMTDRAKSAEQLVTSTNADMIRARESLLLLLKHKFSSALMVTQRCLMNDPTVYNIDDYAYTQGVYGLDISEKLFWEGYVVANDITRPKGSKYETGRPSMPEFQQMNIDTLRNWSDKSVSSPDNISSADHEVDPRPVLWHGDCGRLGEEAPEEYNPLCPLGLLMAYEENGKVIPVVSDFDCFLMGTRGVKYHEPLGAQELSMLSMCVHEIEGILSTPKEGCWTQRWLEVKKNHAMNADESSHEMPRFGYADPRSYKIMTGAVDRLKSNGAVRHGPECFNYGFPQDLDDQYLVVSDTFDGVPWRYVNPEQLIDVLCEKIDEGFTFPLNPKWILCDPGWKKVYDKLLVSQKPNVQDSMSIWYPDEIRVQFDNISTQFPDGFVDLNKRRCGERDRNRSSGVMADLAGLELRKYKIRIEAKKKMTLNRKSFVKNLYESARVFQGISMVNADRDQAAIMQDENEDSVQSITATTTDVSNTPTNRGEEVEEEKYQLLEVTNEDNPKASNSSIEGRKKSRRRFRLLRRQESIDQSEDVDQPNHPRRKKFSIASKISSIRDVMKRHLSG